MEISQKTSNSHMVGMGAKELCSTKATCSNKQEVNAPASTENTSKPAQLDCVNTKPCTVKQSEGSEPGRTNRIGNHHHGERIVPVAKNVR